MAYVIRRFVLIAGPPAPRSRHRLAPAADLTDLSAHEAALEKRHARSSRLWGQPFTIENMLDTLEAALTCPPSEPTQAKLPETAKKPTR